jgi:hypothetical protein
MEFKKGQRVADLYHPEWRGTVVRIEEWDVGPPYVGVTVQWDEGSGPYDTYEMNYCVWLPEELRHVEEGQCESSSS